ncbi:putative Transcription activator effector binding [uncultured delta proteobacterium]|uniref:Putative Transcription activator effector binding n=1 Tax=uncultured delta proteobacterium TaxID=34034 RepID=A0A212J4C6_9DELT|nr:putative Transcription activator effector binding [uncultured delta proteobacterium]
MVSVSIVTRPSLSLIGMRVRTSMADAQRDCGALWHTTFCPRMDELAALGNGDSYGVSWGVDYEAGIFDYWAAMPAPPDVSAPAGMARTELPEGLYAELAVPSLADLPASYAAIYEEWLPRQKEYAPNFQAPAYELYKNDYNITGSLMLYCPLKCNDLSRINKL